MMQLLYTDFLENKQTYLAAQAYWKGLFEGSLSFQGITTEPYLNTIDDFDGNLISTICFRR